MFLNLVISAILWTTFVTLLAQAISIIFLWWLGLQPRKLIHEIEITQNTAVGAVFFIISLTSSLFIGLLAAEPAPASSALEEVAWVVGGLALAALYTAIAFAIAHRVMGRENGENVYRYLRREIIAEQNAALTFFMGGLAVAPFIAVLYQIV